MQCQHPLYSSLAHPRSPLSSCGSQGHEQKALCILGDVQCDTGVHSGLGALYWMLNAHGEEALTNIASLVYCRW